jgi:hypothetical protein
VVSKRSCAAAAKSGSTTANSIRTAGRKMDYRVGAKNVRENVLDTKTKARKSICDLKIVIGSPMASSRNIAASVKDGKTRISFTRITERRTA